MQLLQEYFPIKYNKELLTESENNNKPFIIRHVLLQHANTKNQNERIYPKDLLIRESDKYLEHFVKQRRAMGEIDHPESAQVNLKNVSHNVISMVWEGDELYGDIEILTTPSGNIVKELMKNNIRLGISSRGVGSVGKLGEALHVEDDYQLICFDIVSNPSTRGAFLSENSNVVNASKTLDEFNSLIVDFLSELRVN